MKMPDLTTTHSPIRLIRWLVEPGTSVTRGQALCEIETDKATSEVESIATGVLKEMRIPPDKWVSAGDVMAVLEVAGPSAVPPAAVLPSSPSSPPPAASAGTGALPGRSGSGWLARNRALAAQQGTPVQGVNPILSPHQRTVGLRLQASKQTIPHFYLQTSANAEPMIARRRSAMPRKLAWDALFAWAAGQALQAFERMGWRMEDADRVTQGADAVGVAVDLRGELHRVVMAMNIQTTATTMTIGPMVLTKKACQPPAATMEAAVTATLTGEVTYTIEADRLTVTAKSGAGLMLKAAP